MATLRTDGLYPMTFGPLLCPVLECSQDGDMEVRNEIDKDGVLALRLRCLKCLGKMDAPPGLRSLI